MVALEDKRQHFTKHGDISENMTTFLKKNPKSIFPEHNTISKNTTFRVHNDVSEKTY